MEPKEIDIEFTRGDTCPLVFNLKDINGNPIILSQNDEIYFTIKRSFNATDIILQKRFSKGEVTYNKENQNYSLVLKSEDTAGLNYGSYVYDICVKSIDLTRTVAIGNIVLTNESTFSANE